MFCVYIALGLRPLFLSLSLLLLSYPRVTLQYLLVFDRDTSFQGRKASEWRITCIQLGLVSSGVLGISLPVSLPCLR